MEGFLLLISWVFLSFVVGIGAGRRGRSSGGWALIAILISPLFATLLLIALREPQPNDQTHIRCKACAEWCSQEAQICKWCGTPLREVSAQPLHVGQVSSGEFHG